MKTFKNFLLESAKTVQELNQDNNICLCIVKQDNYTKFILYTKNQNDVIATIIIEKSNEKGFSPYDCYKIAKSAVNENYKGYGPTLYDIVLQYCGKNGLSPDRTVSPDARKIWEYYFNKRNDVDKKPIDNFRSPLTEDPKDDGKLISPFSISDKGAYPKTIDDTTYINHVYFSKVQPQYDNLIKNHENVKSNNSNIETELLNDSKTLISKRVDNNE